MRKSKFSEVQIAAILKEAEAGVAVAEVARKHGISAATFYRWRSKYGGMEVSDLQRMRELEQENARLKRMYADLSLDNSILANCAQRPIDHDKLEKLITSAT
jgi:putative transposase